jgi:hypothetical protein
LRRTRCRRLSGRRRSLLLHDPVARLQYRRSVCVHAILEVNALLLATTVYHAGMGGLLSVVCHTQGGGQSFYLLVPSFVLFGESRGRELRRKPGRTDDARAIS